MHCGWRFSTCSEYVIKEGVYWEQIIPSIDSSRYCTTVWLHCIANLSGGYPELRYIRIFVPATWCYRLPTIVWSCIPEVCILNFWLWWRSKRVVPDTWGGQLHKRPEQQTHFTSVGASNPTRNNSVSTCFEGRLIRLWNQTRSKVISLIRKCLSPQKQCNAYQGHVWTTSWESFSRYSKKWTLKSNEDSQCEAQRRKTD